MTFDTLNISTTTEEELPRILNILSNIRTHIIKNEYNLQDIIASILKRNDIAFKKEYKLAHRNRIDFLLASGIGIEVKKGKPDRNQVIHQLERYASFNQINSIILVVERNLDIPHEINGKRCVSFGLNKLWGVALR